jgi:predicted Rossmann fold nucleotide-binding protein DprA/Smf involved in DNA uptake
VTSAEDVLELFGLTRELRERPTVGADAEAVLTALPAGVDEVARATGLAAGAVAAALAELELAGLAREGEGVYRASE